MSTNWTDPTGDDYRRYTGAPHLSGGTGADGPQETPPGSYVAPGTQPMAVAPAPPPGPVGQPYPGYPGYQGYPGYPGSPNDGPGYVAPGMPYGAYGQPGSYGYPGPGSPYSGPPVGKGPIITLLVLSALLTMTTCILGIPSLVLSIIALTRATTDGASAKRLSRIGWVVFAVCAVLTVAFWVIVLVVARSSSSSGTHQVIGNV